MHKHPFLRAFVAIALAVLWIIAINHVGAQTSAGAPRAVSQAWTPAATRLHSGEYGDRSKVPNFTTQLRAHGR